MAKTISVRCFLPAVYAAVLFMQWFGAKSMVDSHAREAKVDVRDLVDVVDAAEVDAADVVDAELAGLLQLAGLAGLAAVVELAEAVLQAAVPVLVEDVGPAQPVDPAAFLAEASALVPCLHRKQLPESLGDDRERCTAWTDLPNTFHQSFHFIVAL